LKGEIEMFKSVIVAISVILIATGCQNASNPLDPQANSLGQLMNLSTSHPMKPFLDRYSAVGVVGVVDLFKNRYSIYNGNNPQPVDTTTYSAVATIRKASNLNQGAVMENLWVNTGLLVPFDVGQYRWEVAQPSSRTVNFGSGWNLVKADTGPDYPAFRDSVQFGSAIVMTNTTRGTTISKASNYTISWSGSGTDFVEVSLLRDAIEVDPTYPGAQGIMKFADNTGTVTLNASELGALPNGRYDLSVTQYEPKYVTMPGGKKLVVLGRSEHEVTVTISN
jgi:hypothetical protein